MPEGSHHTPATVEVRGWQDDRLAMQQVCESEEEARALAEQWAELGLTRIEIDDFTVHHRGEAILGPDLEIDPAADEDRSR